MPNLLNSAVPLTGTSGTGTIFIRLNDAQPLLGATPSADTGYALYGSIGNLAFTSTMGGISFADGVINRQVDGDSLVISVGTGTIAITGSVTATSTTTGGLNVTPGISTPGKIYSSTGQPSENYLLYTPRLFVGAASILTDVVPRVGDFWIDIASNAEYQYINDGGQKFWLQITTI